MPAVGIIASTVLASIAMVVSYLGASGATVFNTLVLMTGITAAIPYAFSALAQIKWRRADQRELHTPRFARDVTRGRRRAGLLDPVHLVLAQHRPGALVRGLGPFLMAGVAFLLGIPVYLSHAEPDDRAAAGPA